MKLEYTRFMKDFRYKIDRVWVAKERQGPILKKLSHLVDKQCDLLASEDFAVEFYSSLEHSDEGPVANDYFLLMQTIKGYLENYNKSLKLLIFCLNNAPKDVMNSLALQTRSLLEISAILFTISSKDIKTQLNIARARRLRSLAEKISSSNDSEGELRKAYQEQLNDIQNTTSDFDKYQQPESFTISQFKKHYGRFSEHIENIKPIKESLLKGRLTDKDDKYYVNMYENLSAFVHGDPLANNGAEDQPIWFTTMSLPLTCLTVELIDAEIFSSKDKNEIKKCIKAYDEDAFLLRNLDPLQSKTVE